MARFLTSNLTRSWKKVLLLVCVIIMEVVIILKWVSKLCVIRGNYNLICLKQGVVESDVDVFAKVALQTDTGSGLLNYIIKSIKDVLKENGN